MKKLFILFCLLAMSLPIFASTLTFNITTPGTLSSKLSSYSNSGVTTLKVSGKLNGTDIGSIVKWAPQESSNLQILDLSDASIVAGGSYESSVWGSRRTITNSDNEVSFGMFQWLGVTTLKLPRGITVCDMFIFSDSPNLTDVYIYETTPPSFENRYNVLNNYFGYSLKKITLHVPAGTKSAYSSATGWSTLSNIVEETVLATGISVSPSTATVNIGSYLYLSASVSPSNTTNSAVTWSSSNTNVVTVTSSGRIHGVGAGTAKIFARTVDGSNLTDYCSVTVKPVYATGISVSPSTASIKIGSYLYLSASVSPSNTTNSAVTWSSSNTNVVTVTSSGRIHGVGAGTAKIFARTVDGSNLTDYCSVTVMPIYVTGISINPSLDTLLVGETRNLAANVTPSNATNKTLRWASSNTDVATVNSGGQVTAVAEGIATITATSTDGSDLSASSKIVVKSDGNWVDLTPDFNKTIIFKRVRVKPYTSGLDQYVEARFSHFPNGFGDPVYGINTYSSQAGSIDGDDEIDYDNCVKLTKVGNPVGNGWYEYELPFYCSFHSYQKNTHFGTIKVLVEYPGTLKGDVDGNNVVNTDDVTELVNTILQK